MIAGSLIGSLVILSSAMAAIPKSYNCTLPGSHLQTMKPAVSQYVGYGISATCSIQSGVCSCIDTRGKKCAQSGLIPAVKGQSCSVTACLRTSKKDPSLAPVKTYRCAIMGPQDWIASPMPMHQRLSNASLAHTHHAMNHSATAIPRSASSTNSF